MGKYLFKLRFLTPDMLVNRYIPDIKCRKLQDTSNPRLFSYEEELLSEVPENKENLVHSILEFS